MPITTGWGVRWDGGENHTSGTETGFTALAIEGAAVSLFEPEAPNPDTRPPINQDRRASDLQGARSLTVLSQTEPDDTRLRRTPSRWLGSPCLLDGVPGAKASNLVHGHVYELAGTTLREARDAWGKREGIPWLADLPGSAN